MNLSQPWNGGGGTWLIFVSAHLDLALFNPLLLSNHNTLIFEFTIWTTLHIRYNVLYYA